MLTRPVRIMPFFRPITLCSNSFQISLLCFHFSLLWFVVLLIMLTKLSLRKDALASISFECSCFGIPNCDQSRYVCIATIVRI